MSEDIKTAYLRLAWISGFNLIQRTYQQGINTQLFTLWGHRENKHTQAHNMPICHQKTHSLISFLPKQLTRFGRFDASEQLSPSMKPQDNGSALVREPNSHVCQLFELGFQLSHWRHTKTDRDCPPRLFGSCRGEFCLQRVLFLKQEQNGDPGQLRLQRGETETSSHVKASPEKTLTAIIVCHALRKRVMLMRPALSPWPFGPHTCSLRLHKDHSVCLTAERSNQNILPPHLGQKWLQFYNKGYHWINFLQGSIIFPISLNVLICYNYSVTFAMIFPNVFLLPFKIYNALSSVKSDSK